MIISPQNWIKLMLFILFYTLRPQVLFHVSKWCISRLNLLWKRTFMGCLFILCIYFTCLQLAIFKILCFGNCSCRHFKFNLKIFCNSIFLWPIIICNNIALFFVMPIPYKQNLLYFRDRVDPVGHFQWQEMLRGNGPSRIIICYLYLSKVGWN